MQYQDLFLSVLLLILRILVLDLIIVLTKFLMLSTGTIGVLLRP